MNKTLNNRYQWNVIKFKCIVFLCIFITHCELTKGTHQSYRSRYYTS